MSALRNIQTIALWTERKVELCCQRRYWKLILACFCVVLVFFVAFPNIEHISESNHEFTTWGVVKEQIKSPLTPSLSSDPDSHNAKRTFRLAVPVLFKILNVHSIWSMYLFQLGIAVFFFWLVASLSDRIVRDHVLSVVLTLSFAFIYIGQSGITDVMAKFDIYAITCMLAAMYFRSALLTFIFLTFAVWTDERAVAGCGLVFVFFRIQEAGLDNFRLKSFIQPDRNSLAVIGTVAFYLVLRAMLIQYLDFKTVLGSIGIAYFVRQMNMLFFGIWSAFEGFWLMILASLLSLLYKRAFGLLIPLTILSLTQITTSFFVVDITRSLIYMVPLVFISTYILAQTELKHDFRTLCILTLLICVLVPTYFAEGGFRIEGSNPLLVKLAGWIF